jgi:hypothetical protein
MFEAAYTLAKNLTDVDEVADVEGGTVIEDAFHRARDKGNAQYSPRNRFVSSFVYELPFGPGKAFLNHKSFWSEVFGGWQLSGNVILQSGLYYTPSFSGADPSNTNTFGGRPDVVGNFRLANQSITNWFNPSAFAVPQPGRFGNAGNGIIEGPGEQIVNAGLFKTFDITEKLHLRVQGSFTNILNHPNFAAPNLNISSAAAGQITSVQTANFAGPRAGQIGARLEF